MRVQGKYYFVVSVLKYWAQEYEDRLADLIKEQLTRLNGTTNANKNKRSRYVNSAEGGLTGTA